MGRDYEDYSYLKQKYEKDKERKTREAQKTNSIKLRRISGLIRVTGFDVGKDWIYARLVSVNIMGKEVEFFVSKPILPDSKILVKLHKKENLIFHGRVTWCKENSNQSRKVISVNPLTHIIGVHLAFENEEERQAFKTKLENKDKAA